MMTEHQQTVKSDREKKSSKKDTGMTQEELLRFQEEMFRKSRERLQAGGGPLPQVEDQNAE